MRFAFITILACLVSFTVHADSTKQLAYTPPKEGIILNQDLAVQVAKDILAAHYGEKFVKSREPYMAVLMSDNDTWVINGAVPHHKGALDGAIQVRLSKSDGRVISILHP